MGDSVPVLLDHSGDPDGNTDHRSGGIHAFCNAEGEPAGILYFGRMDGLYDQRD